ncbi:MAG TPA: TlpA disulfide reductase family protein [Candidatus Limnocylindrales bacterium]|nr:TlpA disulfide reductase family protein [Candidatus Limnocylindrales bacterium]
MPGSTLLNEPAPDFELERLDGSGTLRLADLRGRPVLVNFWASWCLPCREEFPLFREVRDRHHQDGLEIVGVVHRDGPEAARRFAAEEGGDWPMVLDPDELAWRAYGGQLLPITFFIDREGVVRSVSFGPPPRQVLDQHLARIL